MTKEKKTKETKALWEFPWKYKESFLIATGLLLVGFLIEYATGGKGIRTVSWPINIFILLVFINIIVVTHLTFKDKPFIKWIRSVPTAVSAITMFTVLILLMGFTTQEDQTASEFIRKLGLSHVTSSWPYLMIQLYFLTTLGFVVMKRIWPLNRKNFGFLLNHFGLWIMIVAASLGAGDLIKLNMQLEEGKTVMVARDYEGNYYEMPLAIKLDNFNIEEYNPKVGIVDNKVGGLAGEEGENIFEVEDGYVGTIDQYTFKVLSYMPKAARTDSGYIEFLSVGAVHAAFIEVKNNATDDIRSGWITCGNSFTQYESLKIDEAYSLVMLNPEPKEFSSDVVVYTESIGEESLTIEVNEPYSVDGWKIYQTGYDEKMGRDSNISIVEVVKDPWILYVYIGIFMVIAGAGFIFWEGRKVKKD
jgi:hypothetical protein